MGALILTLGKPIAGLLVGSVFYLAPVRMMQVEEMQMEAELRAFEAQQELQKLERQLEQLDVELEQPDAPEEAPEPQAVPE